MAKAMLEKANIQNKEDKKEFIGQHFGADILSKIQNKHRGGVSSRKGSRYEDQFLLHKLLQVAVDNNDWDNHRLSCQNLDFLDDVCYENLSTKAKHNYQLKNSSGSVADWDSEISQLARFQYETDLKFHCMTESYSYLVVSDERKANNNKEKIPEDLINYAKCEYFPYYEKLIDLVNHQLMTYICALTGSTALDDGDYCANLLLGILGSNTQSLTVSEILNKAGSEGFPNPFRQVIDMDTTLPIWFKVLLDSYLIKYNLNKGILSLSYKNLETKFPLFVFSVEQQSYLQQCEDIQEFWLTLQSMVGELLKPKH